MLDASGNAFDIQGAIRELEQLRAECAEGEGLLDIVPEYPAPGVPFGQEEFEAAARVLSVRRSILDRLANIDVVEGRKKRHDAEVMQCEERLEREKELPVDRRLDLLGRRDEAAAKSAWCVEKVKHYRLELQLYYRALRG